MTTSSWRSPFFFQVLALTGILLVVHSFYVVVVRPNAEADLQAQAELIAREQSNATTSSSFYVIIKDYEQEACFIMLFWAILIMGYKGQHLQQAKKLLDEALIQVNLSILPGDARGFLRLLEGLPNETREMLPAQVLSSALQRFDSTGDVQDAREAVNTVCEQAADQMDSELSMIRYLVWAIPSVGFIGTVRGIGAALGEAHKAVAGDIAGVTANLGVAFNSTFVALMLSIILMFLVHQLQLTQERLVANSRDYADQNLLRHMRGGS